MEKEQSLPIPDSSEPLISTPDVPIPSDEQAAIADVPTDDIAATVEEELPQVESGDIADILDDPELAILLSDEDKTIRCNPAPETIDQTMVFSVPETPETVSVPEEPTITAEDIIAEFSDKTPDEAVSETTVDDTVCKDDIFIFIVKNGIILLKISER